MENPYHILMATSLPCSESKELIKSIFICPQSILNLNSSTQIASQVPEKQASPSWSWTRAGSGANYATQLPKNLPRQNKSGKNVQLMIKCSHKNCKLSTRAAVFFFQPVPACCLFFSFFSAGRSWSREKGAGSRKPGYLCCLARDALSKALHRSYVDVPLLSLHQPLAQKVRIAAAPTVG